MTTSATLQELARQVRGGTLQILEGTHPRWLTFAPAGTSNHVLWHAGHALWLQDLLCIELLTGTSELPAAWERKFGMNCDPVASIVDWPTRESVLGLLRRQLERIVEVLGAATDQQLARVADPRRGPATVSDRIIHGLHDEARHSGEMYLLWKLCRTRGL
jgi:hypothetical protein